MCLDRSTTTCHPRYFCCLPRSCAIDPIICMSQMWQPIRDSPLCDGPAARPGIWTNHHTVLGLLRHGFSCTISTPLLSIPRKSDYNQSLTYRIFVFKLVTCCTLYRPEYFLTASHMWNLSIIRSHRSPSAAYRGLRADLRSDSDCLFRL